MNFLEMSDEEIAAFIESHITEFGDYYFEPSDIIGRPIAIERWQHGFAVIGKPYTYEVSLQFLYVTPEHRGRGIGKGYLRQVIQRYGQEWRMTLKCHKRLRPFYSRHGFRVESRDGDYRKMMMREDW